MPSPAHSNFLRLRGRPFDSEGGGGTFVATDYLFSAYLLENLFSGIPRPEYFNPQQNFVKAQKKKPNKQTNKQKQKKKKQTNKQTNENKGGRNVGSEGVGQDFPCDFLHFSRLPVYSWYIVYM